MAMDNRRAVVLSTAIVFGFLLVGLRLADLMLLDHVKLTAKARRQQQVQVDRRMKGMFKFPSFRRLGTATFEGDLGTPSSAELGDGFRVSFLAESTGFAQDSPWGSPDPGNRIHLRWLTLDHVKVAEGGNGETNEVLRTSIFLAPKQKVFIGAGRSEDSKEGLVLIVQAQDIGGS